jgi:hypothetical protein
MAKNKDLKEVKNESIYGVEDIYDMCMGKDIDEAEEILRKNFNNVRFCDEKIDDGLDDGGYLMMSSFDVDGHYVRLYYPDDDYIITDVDV